MKTRFKSFGRTKQNPHATGRTPAGVQSLAVLARRRLFVALGCGGLYALLLLWLAAILGYGGWSPFRAAIFVAFAIAAPWSVLGLCNAALGFWLLHFAGNGMARAAPFVDIDVTLPLQSRAAVLMTLRNEDARRAISRLRRIKTSLDATGQGWAFDFFVLSDTNEPSAAASEEAEIAAWRRETKDQARIFYRRRHDNDGFKAGNIADFCENWGEDYEFMLPLDADSLMDGETILRLLRIGEKYPQLGIVQTLVVGAPSSSAFARIFQFGMRAGMRCYSMGAAWWTADCGPYWGHNALVRIAPFTRHCGLPKLSDGAAILSHDQIEAALMRRGGYEVRLLPVEGGSFEENPPSLLDFIQREARWCRGNMQYGRLLATPGLLPVSRFQLCWAISMFLGAPASIAILLLGACLPLFDPRDLPTGSLIAFYLVNLALPLAPKFAGLLDVAATPGAVARYGGGGRFAASALIEILCSMLVGAATGLNICLLLLALPFGGKIFWAAQARDAHGVSWRAAFLALWPQLLFGLLVVGLAASVSPNLALWSLPLTFGYFAAIPFAVVSAAPRLGRWFVGKGLCASPEEFCPPPILRDRNKEVEARALSVAAASGEIAIEQDFSLAE